MRSRGKNEPMVLLPNIELEYPADLSVDERIRALVHEAKMRTAIVHAVIGKRRVFAGPNDDANRLIVKYERRLRQPGKFIMLNSQEREPQRVA